MDLQVKKVIQYSQDGKFVKEWNSIKEASETLGIDRTSISKSIHGVCESAGGFVWRAVKQSPTYNKRPISQYSLKGEFIRDWENVSDAIAGTGIKTIFCCLNSGKKSAGGYQWKYKDSNKEIKQYTVNRIYKGTPIYQYGLDGKFIKQWKSYVAASKDLGIPEQHIDRVLKGERRMTHGYLFNYEFHTDGIEPYDKNKNDTFRKVKQYSLDGRFIKEFPTITEAQKSINLRYGIGPCCKGVSKTAGGFQWKYSDDPKEILPIETKRAKRKK